MSVLGLSLLIASFSFFCYRCPPSSWLITKWLRHPSVSFEPKTPQGDAPVIELSDASAAEDNKVTSNGNIAAQSRPIPVVKEGGRSKQELDRKAMPPPPPSLFKKPTQTSPESPIPTTQPGSPPTPRASQRPSFSLSNPDTQEAEPTVPSFPALNSAQRASGGVQGRQRLNSIPARQPQVSGGGLMPPPLRAPLPNRGPPSLSGSSLAPPPTHTTIPTKPRRKVLLTPGHSPLDWARLSSSPNANLSGLPPGTPYLRVPPSLLRQMTGRKGKDAWTVLGGKVYNISPYMPYHPGGTPELMKAAGRDGTRLFGEVHPWVNWEGMLEGCLVGIAVEEGEVKGGSELEAMD